MVGTDKELDQLVRTDNKCFCTYYLGVHRVVIVDITLRAGRTGEQKKALYARIAELAAEYAATEPRNAFVTVHQNQFADWSFGDGIGQYLERKPGA